jgi:hypothetical protein
VATLWIREYRNSGVAGAGRAIQVPAEPGADQTPVTFTTSAQSAAFASTTTFIAIIGSAAFHYVVAANPTATTDALKVPANTLVHVGVLPGQKIAAIAAA